MGLTTNKIQEGMRAEMRKLQTEITDLKYLVDEMKNSQDEVQKIVEDGKSSQISQQLTRELWEKFNRSNI